MTGRKPTFEDCQLLLNASEEFWIDINNSLPDCERCLDRNYLIECKCGCGEIRARKNKHGSRREFIRYHGEPGYSFGSGSDNLSWRGDEVGYHGIHKRMYKIIQKPDQCPRCGLKKVLELASISGEYRLDPNDWEYLCIGCHMIVDGRLERLKHGGHPCSEETKEKLRVQRTGKKASLETRKKMSIDRLGEKNSFHGKHHSEASKEKNRLAHIGKTFNHTEKTKQKMRLARILYWEKHKNNH
jgi:NUMOD3 motif